ncbi:MAG TPA: 1,2-phenylacetyl-CoA epoxidase subunit PaaC [Candidatus Lumbricidophila sp.]|nr:1,2-phenylacetyl-CoA epoxidase subunit PaaC [Candidatus Lumbricidophila sp.]
MNAHAVGSHQRYTKRAISAAVSPEIVATWVDAGTAVADPAVAQYALGIADDLLILAQQLGAWISHAPELEEDLALGNIGLDLLGQARSLLTYAGSAWGKSEDDLAYFRDESEFRCRWLFELPNGDFGQTIARQLVASVVLRALFARLADSRDSTLAAISAKAVKEVEYHVDHAAQWVRRLGLGTAESNRRMQASLDFVWPYVDELFQPDPQAAGLDGIAVDPTTLRGDFEAVVPPLIEASGLQVPIVTPSTGGGRFGIHTEHLGRLLAELQVLARQHPGAVW